MTDITLEQRARELLAAECKKPCSYDEPHIPTRHAHAALEAALRLSAGADLVLVPREPTEAMREAFKNIPLTLDDMLFQTRAWAGLEPGVRNVDDVATAADRRDFGKRYVAMLAAAPKPEDS